MKNSDGSESVYGSFPFPNLIAIRKCACEDGQRRFVQITGHPDTCFSVPARTKLDGKTISGFVTYTSKNPNLSGNLPLFTATGKNEHLISSDYLHILAREYRRLSSFPTPPRADLWEHYYLRLSLGAHTMTRKDYILIASALNATKPKVRFPNDQSEEEKAARYQWQYDCSAIASAFATDNYRFDRDRFISACDAD